MNTLSYSFADWCFAKEPSADFYRQLFEYGYRAAEMVPRERWDMVRDAGLQLLNIGAPGMGNGLNRSENHATLIPAIRETIRIAAGENIPQVIVFSGNRAAPDGWEQCRIALLPLVADAEAAGVQLVFEMLNSFDHKNYDADSARYGFELVRSINSSALRVLYDVYHMKRMGEPVETQVRENLPMIGHLHVADTPRRTRPTETGEIDYQALYAMVRDAGYTGYWGFEFLPGADVLGELREAVSR